MTPAEGHVVVDGARVVYRAWGDPARPGVLLVHGGAAHSRWWDGVVPHLGDRHIVAIDLTGHGDSDWRSAYAYAGWGDEIGAVARELFGSPPVVVGHSLGGVSAFIAAGTQGEDFAVAVAVDSPLNHHAKATLDKPSGVAGRGRAVKEELTARFRPLHASGREVPATLSYVAEHSARLTDDGYRWKFDPAFTRAHREPRVVPLASRCPLVFVACETGLATKEMTDHALTQPGGEHLEVIVLEGAGHNPMLEPPEPLAELLTGLLDRFERSPSVP